jgi:tyrosyl-tRNA synthetase
MEAKKNLAEELVAQFHGMEAARAERERFGSVFSRHEVPEEMAEMGLSGEPMTVVDALFKTGLYPSRKEIRRLVEQGAVRLSGERVGPEQILGSESVGSILQVGRRQFFRIV